MGNENSLAHSELRKQAVYYYDKVVRPKIEDLAGTSDIPDSVVKMSIQGKPITKSDIDNFKDAVQCYDYILNQNLLTSTSGATAAGTLTAEPMCLYIPFNADMKVYDPFGKMTIFDEIELVLLSETAGKKQAYVGHTMKAARLIMSPIKFSRTCMALIFAYNEYAFKYMGIDPETGNKEGVVESYDVNFQTGKKQ